MSITAFENLVSTAERRALQNGADHTTVRLSDFMGIIPAITGKVELVYEGEQEGAAQVAQHLLGDAIHTFFPAYFPKVEKLEKFNEKTPYSDIIEWFFSESGFELLDDCNDELYKETLDAIVPLEILIKKYQPQVNKKDVYFMKEFLLWGLVEYDKLSKDRVDEGYQFKDKFGSYLSKL
jgi:magnesium chelatase subunit I